MSIASDVKPQVVIVGAGFGGVQAAQALVKADVQITIIDKHNYHLFPPLLYQVATAGLSEKDIVCPVRSIFREQKNVEFCMDEFVDVDFANKRAITKSRQVAFDYLLIATGSTSNFFGLQTLSEHAFAMKSLSEAVSIRNHIIQMFELAAYEQDQDKRRALLTFVVVGGGPTGVESAGALSELIYFVLTKEYHHLNFKEVRIVLVEASDTLLPVMPPDLQEATIKTLSQKKVEVRLLVQVSDYDGTALSLKGGEIIPTRTVIWAAGVRAHDQLDKLGVEQDRGHRVMVNDYLQLSRDPAVFVIGDAAHFKQDGVPLPMVAPVAVQQAVVAADNILNLIHERPLRKFVYKPLGDVATIGRNAAVVHIGRFKAKGFIAWVIWSVVHIMRLVRFRNRTVVFMKWMWEYLTYDRIEHAISRDDE
ncbi:MAG: NAD(P)/FAD-dependent oxidoreductase [Negativicutes bacterium]|nr:NAD(P)/FAD-dependent oxidoreductase [Negativicutes bacterium]